ncbi:hypothetical protein [Thiohalorhabdus methylotrophus]|uniref:DUF4384 domain-containing protein n=1 Tax=Thiohalorhabdus methylotrophus TaxID=3242694 RepID=A0ABV4TWU6_9GAMM
MGEGRGKTRQAACRSALAGLAESLQVEVRASLRVTKKSSRAGSGGSRVSTSALQDIQTSTNLPLLGTEQKARRSGGELICTARLEPGRARSLYGERLRDLRSKAGELEAALEETSLGKQRHRLLTELLALADRYDRFALVARFLGLEVPSMGARSAAELRVALDELERVAPSLDLAAEQLVQDLPDDTIHLTPPHPAQSGEVTPFARALESAMAKRLQTTSEPTSADYRLRGEYQVTEQGVSVAYRLTDRNHVTREVRTARLAPEAYAHLRVEPETVSFDRLLHQGLAVDDDFRASLATNQGREDLLFRKGQEVELLIKLNRPGYYYLTGHTIRDGQSYSYLVPLQDGRGDRRFVRYMNAEETNKWVSLGAFEVAQPFGVESMQMIASSEDLVGELPDYTYDKAKGLYMLGGDASEGVTKTRALKPKTSEAVKSAEAVLMFTTAPKR